MSRLFGPLRQMGYVVKDIDAAMRYWIDVCQIGPWFYIDKLAVDDFRYKGQPSRIFPSPWPIPVICRSS